MVKKAIAGFVLFSTVIAVAGISFSLFMDPATGKVLDLFKGFKGIFKAGALLALPVGILFLYKAISNAV